MSFLKSFIFNHSWSLVKWTFVHSCDFGPSWPFDENDYKNCCSLMRSYSLVTYSWTFVKYKASLIHLDHSWNFKKLRFPRVLISAENCAFLKGCMFLYSIKYAVGDVKRSSWSEFQATWCNITLLWFGGLWIIIVKGIIKLILLQSTQNRRRRKACGQMNIQVVLCLNLINIGHLLYSGGRSRTLRRTSRGQLTTHNATKRQKQWPWENANEA